MDQKLVAALTASFNAGKLDKAAKQVSKLIRANPRHPDLYRVKAEILHRQGFLEKSANSYLAALKCSPGDAELHFALGIIRQNQNRFDEAKRCYEKAVVLKPDHASAHNNLGVICKLTHQLEDAEKHFESAAAASLDLADPHNNLGVMHLEHYRFQDAANSFRRALAINPNAAETYCNLGSALRNLGNAEEAITCLRKAIELKPDYAAALDNLGGTLRDQGKFEDAIDYYRRALEVDDRYGQTHFNLAELTDHPAENGQLARMEQLAEDQTTGAENRKFICFTLARAFEKRNEPDPTMRWLTAGNELRRKELQYDVGGHEQLFRALEGVAWQELDGPVPPSQADRTPIFVLGMPRSGTSLVEQILATHSQVYGAGELDWMSAQADQVIAGPDWQKPEHRKITAATVTAVRTGYLNALANLGVEERVIVDKLPLNFICIGFIATALPEANIVHVTRNPMATCWSIYKHLFVTPGNGYAYDQLDLARFYNLYRELMQFWHQQFPGRIFDLNYEALTERPETEIRRLLAHCELDWEDECLDFHRTERVVRTASAAQVRKKMYTGSSDAWRKYAAHLQPMIDTLEEGSAFSG